jgi:hypothetical protein
MGVAFVPAARPPSADFPSRCVVPARRASHIHAIAFEVQHRIVPAKPADQLSETPKRPAHDAGRRVGCECRVGCELLGIIGHHGQLPVLLLYDPTRYDAASYSSVSGSCLRNIQEICHGKGDLRISWNANHLRMGRATRPTEECVSIETGSGQKVSARKTY